MHISASRARTGWCALAAAMLAGCGGSPAQPTPPPSASIVRLDVRGLPAPLIFDMPPSLRAGDSYVLTAIATYADGHTAPLESDAVGWITSNSQVVGIENGRALARTAGTVEIGVHGAGGVSTTVDVSVYAPGTVREERSGVSTCSEPGLPVPCPYRFCPGVGPYWLFPVHDGGVVELESVRNPGWGSPSQYVTQLSNSGEYVKSWLLLPGNPEFRTARVPGGYMYVFTMSADLGPCGPVGAVWKHPG